MNIINRKNALVFLLLGSVSLEDHYAKASSDQHGANIVVTFDEGNEWQAAFVGGSPVVTGMLADAIDNKVPVIITSPSLLFNLVVASDTFENNLNRADDLEKIWNMSNARAKLNDEDIRESFNEKRPYWVGRNSIGQLEGTNPQWMVFLNKPNNLAVLVCNWKLQSAEALVKNLGLALNELTFVSAYALHNKFGDVNFRNKPLNIENFSKLFTTGANIPKKRIFIMGHGLEGEDRTPQTGRPIQETAQEKILRISGEKLKRAVIAQMTSEEYIEFLKVLKTINTEFLYILSCFAGGINLLKMHNLLIDQTNTILDKQFSVSQVPYYIVIGTTTGTEATYRFVGPDNAETAHYLSDFFGSLDKFLENPRPYLKKPLTKTEPVLIKDVLQNIYKRFPVSTNYPLIRFPGTLTFFRPVEVDKQVIITYVGLQTYILESKQKGLEPNIKISSGTKDLFIYPANLQNVQLTFNGTEMPHLVSKIEGAAQHYIGKIDAQDIDFINLANEFCPELRAERGRSKSPKAWFIDQCSCKNYVGSIFDESKLPLHGLVIYHYDTNFTDIIFKYAAKYYQISKANYGDKLPLTSSQEFPIKWNQIDQPTYSAVAYKIYEATQALPEAMQHATAGNENLDTLAKCFKLFLKRVEQSK